MKAQMSVLGLKLSSYLYLRSAMVRFPLDNNNKNIEVGKLQVEHAKEQE